MQSVPEIVESIVIEVSREFHVSVDLIRGKKKTTEYVNLRKIITIVSRYFLAPYEVIGEKINRDHSSLLNYKTDYFFEEENEIVINKIKQLTIQKIEDYVLKKPLRIQAVGIHNGIRRINACKAPTFTICNFLPSYFRV